LDPHPQRVFVDADAKTAAFFVRTLPALVDARLIEELKTYSETHGRCNVRICLHDAPDALHHDMVALERRDRYYRPHKHLRKGDTFHLLEGRLGIFSFDDVGVVIDAVVIGPGEIYRTAANAYHAIMPLTDYVIHHESKLGPFEGSGDSIYPDWAPDACEVVAVKKYLEMLTTSLPGETK
jgi:cupin fold WbuC family metalloprotein